MLAYKRSPKVLFFNQSNFILEEEPLSHCLALCDHMAECRWKILWMFSFSSSLYPDGDAADGAVQVCVHTCTYIFKYTCMYTYSRVCVPCLAAGHRDNEFISSFFFFFGFSWWCLKKQITLKTGHMFIQSVRDPFNSIAPFHSFWA